MNNNTAYFMMIRNSILISSYLLLLVMSISGCATSPSPKSAEESTLVVADSGSPMWRFLTVITTTVS